MTLALCRFDFFHTLSPIRHTVYLVVPRLLALACKLLEGSNIVLFSTLSFIPRALLVRVEALNKYLLNEEG